ncbi:glycoside hydrolase family 20 zincin-like fold domain-containing protein [Bacteroides faecis]|uniref:glycoside hydrolase family 20 zincin-like fold domain-containing protein n=1 Tax=Bacteroides faecis TaxID=674529 RepID=UPI00216446CD|nr:glycoside hydrolase family 20 zincin-like fold domain-containing protein [Bacteroides faecis]UVR63474.1 glycoside hydrolase family 20 zincin-like fold domain-containing protein [Bacteroides faecis]UVS32739.1 glycoside hydrolase family 20 zincin-like fold domain-containing protein [Bacteroides faecis]
MRKHHLLGAILLCGGLFSCSSEVIQQANYEIIPLPQEIKISTGNFVLNDRTSIVYLEKSEYAVTPLKLNEMPKIN